MGNQTSVTGAFDGPEEPTAKAVDGHDEAASCTQVNARAAGSPVMRSPTVASPTATTTRSSFDALSNWFGNSPRAAMQDTGTRGAGRDNGTKSANGVATGPSDNGARTIRRLEDWYDVHSQHIGRGHYAVVCRGTCRRTGRAVAIKKIKRFLTDPARLKAEIAVLRRVKKHPNIVELIDVFETAREVHLVMELCTGGELFERLADKGPYSEADCVRHITDMANAVMYLHENGIVHRDLKPENILLSTPNDDDAVTKVADFGLAKIFTGSNMKTKCGTWGYSAPEMISGSGISFGYDYKVDSWSIGTIVFILLCGYHPFDPNGTSSDNEMISSIKNCKFDFEDEAWADISEGAKDLIRNLLVLDPAKRFTMKEVLNHGWITGAYVSPSLLPLSPTIHRDLAKYRQQSKQKIPFDFMDDDNDE